MRKIWWAVIPALFLGACVQAPPLNFSVADVGPSSTKLDAEVKSITVVPASPKEAIGPINPATGGLTDIWRNALQEALDRSAIFKDDAQRKVSISVKIVKFEVPSAGFDMVSHAGARYDIIDRATGAIIYTQTVDTPGVVPAGYAFVGVVRARESINRAVQNNIAEFLKSLQTADLSKSMFPGAGQ